jgi:thioredoxin-related protein
LVAAAALIARVTPVTAGELVMFEVAGCPWCAKWHREIGPIYSKTAEAQLLPLRRVDLAAPRPADLSGIDAIRYTPTFVALVDGREIGRVIGYPGEEAFWGMLEAIHEWARQASTSGAAKASANWNEERRQR